MSQRLEIQAPTGLTLYAALLQLGGQVFNATSGIYEATNPANWASYVISLTEVIPTTGVYFGDPPANKVGQGTRLLPIYQQQGTQPASTDPIYTPTLQAWPLVFVLELSPASALIAIAPFRPAGNPWSRQGAVSLPARQDSLSVAQDILNKLYAARLTLATKPFASVNVQGDAVMFTNPQMLDDQIQHWERKVAVLSGKRRRVNALRLDRF